MLRILQINLHHCREASEALLTFLAEHQPDFVLIQEPWVNGGRVCGLRTPSYKLYVAYGNGKTRACIMAKSHYNVFIMHNYSNEDVTVISWERDKNSYRLVSMYLAYDGSGPIPPQPIRELVTNSEAFGVGVIIGGDANAHHTIWGSSDTNERGESLFDYIISSRLLLCNKGNEPTFVIRNRQEVLDITLVSDFLFEKMVQWKVLSQHSFSDHRYIEVTFQEDTSLPNNFRNHRKTDWLMFNRELVRNLPLHPPFTPNNTNSLDNLVRTFTNSCSKALEKACPKRYAKRRKQSPWWSPELNKLKIDCRAQFNLAKRLRTESEWDGYHDKLKLYKKELRKAKRISWRSFCGDVESTADASRLRKILINSTPTIGYLQKPDKSWTVSSEESLDLLLNTHFPENPENGQMEIACNLEAGPEILNIITKSSITWAVKSFKPYKSPGPDGIFPAQLQFSLSHILNWLEIIFKNALRLNHIPSLWKEVKVVFIPKAGKSSHVSPNDFRPITLSSFLLKTLERLIETYIRDKIIQSQLAASQHAYCKGKSTETALNTLVTEIERSIVNKEYTLVAFLDIEGAFNNVLPGAIASALTDFRIPETLVNLIKQMLLCRFVNSKLGAAEMRRAVSRGTPQGGVLSPLLWVLTMNKLLRNLEEGGTRVVAYADDVALAVRGKFPSTLCEIMQSLLSKVDRWSTSCGLSVNATKTELVLFTRKHNLPDVRPPTLNGTNLSFSENARYLGLILDRKLNWNLNVDDRVRKASIALYSCKKTIGLNWGLSPKIVHWLYSAVVRPILLYGILVWWPALDKNVIVKRLTSIQRTASLCISGALRTTPTEALNVMLYLLPIDLYGKQLAAKAALRLRELALLKTFNKGHSTILEKFSTIPATTDFCNSVELNFNTPFTTTFPSKEDWDKGTVDAENKVSIFTDGSKLDEQVGGGVYSDKLGISASFRLPNHCSVFQAEVIAIREGLLLLKKRPLTTREIYIYSDSQAALKSLESVKHSSKTVVECHKLLCEVSHYFKINLIWVPGHKNIEGNCKADELARKGTTLHIHPENVLIPIPLATCKLLIDIHLINDANARWGQSPFCQISRQTWPEWNYGRTISLLNLRRQDMKNTIGVLTGHCLIGRHASRLGVPQNDYCRSCQDVEEEETVEHLLCTCMALYRKRLSTLGLAFLDSIEEVSQIGLPKLTKFIKSTGWFREGSGV